MPWSTPEGPDDAPLEEYDVLDMKKYWATMKFAVRMKELARISPTWQDAGECYAPTPPPPPRVCVCVCEGRRH